ncbi:MAG: efflux RND transporter periplasmic adaptor subunit [Candidatus Ratteibacteria bacterium]
MKKKNIIISVLVILLVLIAAIGIIPHSRKQPPEKDRKILFYRNPMNLEITSPVFKKDEMGMDYLPVYEEEAKPTAPEGMQISPEKQQLVGIKTTEVKKQDLTREIRTVGKIAYDPDLYIAQEEFLQALKMEETSGADSESEAKKEAVALTDAAKQKLLLMGMDKNQVRKLVWERKPQSNLYLAEGQKTIWAYLSVYEYDMGLVKNGLPVEITATAFPGEVFAGKIAAVSPVLDPATRSVQARTEIGNPGGKLKPGMFVNARVKISLGKKLAVPEEAVVNTGERNVVFLATPDGYFQSRDVTLGNKAEGYYEVLSGLKEGDAVVSSGNFFVDSESRLKSAVNR